MKVRCFSAANRATGDCVESGIRRYRARFCKRADQYFVAVGVFDFEAGVGFSL